MQIKKYSPESAKIKALIYGPSGAGKTTFAGTAKNAIFLSAEGGLLSIANKQPDYIEIKSIKDLQEALSFLRLQPHSYDTVIIDSISEINEICKAEIEKTRGRNMQLQDWGVLSKTIRELFRSFRDLPMHVILLAQETYDKDDDKIVRIVPSLNGKAATEIAYSMDIVGYINMKKDKEGDLKRFITTVTDDRLITKDRSNLIGKEAPMDFEEWKERVANLPQHSQEVVVDTMPEVPFGPEENKSINFIEELSAHPINTPATKEQIDKIKDIIATKVPKEKMGKATDWVKKEFGEFDEISSLQAEKIIEALNKKYNLTK